MIELENKTKSILVDLVINNTERPIPLIPEMNLESAILTFSDIAHKYITNSPLPRNADLRTVNNIHNLITSPGYDHNILASLYEKYHNTFDKKKRGKFYTPDTVVEHILEITLKQKIDSTNNLQDLKFLEPSCGTGKFVDRAVKILLKAYLRAGYTYDQAILNIFKRNIYAADIDLTAVQILQTKICLAYGATDTNIVCADFLLKKSYIFKDIKFDIIASNPPYCEARNIQPELRKYYLKNYISSHGKVNLFNLFIERSHELLKENGTLGFIVPVTIMRNERYWAIRKLISEKMTVNEIAACGCDIFSNAIVDCIVIHLTNSPSVDNPTKILDISRQEVPNIISRKDLFHGAGFTILINKDTKTTNFINKIEKGIQLQELCQIKDGSSTGFKPFNYLLLGERIDGYFINGLGKYEVFDESLHKPVIDGQEFGRYSQINWKGRYIRYDKSIEKNPSPKKGRPFNCQLREQWIFESPVKLISRQTSDCLIVTLDEGSYYTRNSIHNIIPKPDTDQDTLLMILGFLNSRVMNIYYRLRYQETSAVYPQVHISALKLLPIIIPDKENLHRIAGRVEAYLESMRNNYFSEESEYQMSFDFGSSSDILNSVETVINQDIMDLYGLFPSEIP